MECVYRYFSTFRYLGIVGKENEVMLMCHANLCAIPLTSVFTAPSGSIEGICVYTSFTPNLFGSYCTVLTCLNVEKKGLGNRWGSLPIVGSPSKDDFTLL